LSGWYFDPIVGPRPVRTGQKVGRNDPMPLRLGQEVQALPWQVELVPVTVAVNLPPPDPESLHPVAGLELGVAMAGIRKPAARICC